MSTELYEKFLNAGSYITEEQSTSGGEGISLSRGLGRPLSGLLHLHPPLSSRGLECMAS